MTLSQADALAEAEVRTGKKVQIGYMRRYAPAFEEAVNIVSDMKGQLRYARVRGMSGPNSLVIEPTSAVIRGDDVSAADLQAGKAATEASLLEAVGTDQNPRAVAYRGLLGFSTHDLSAMREVLGMPKAVLHASMKGAIGCMTAVFDYGDFICQYEVTGFEIAHLDAHLEIFSPNQIVKVEFDTPYVRHQPARLTVTEAKEVHGISVINSFPTRADSFVIEWSRFHQSIVEGTPIKTSVEDARQDLELVSQIMSFI